MNRHYNVGWQRTLQTPHHLQVVLIRESVARQMFKVGINGFGGYALLAVVVHLVISQTSLLSLRASKIKMRRYIITTAFSNQSKKEPKVSK